MIDEPTAGHAPLIITIDGPAGSGKSTVSRLLASRLGLVYLNSGAIYRAVTLAVLEAGVDFENREAVAAIIRGLDFRCQEAEGQARYFLGGREVTHRIKDPDVTEQVYRIANRGDYRKLLVDSQRRFAGSRGVVAEGRDMGTVIFPDAAIKFFLDAPIEERARRQHRELLARGVPSSYEELLENQRRRDHRDTSRADAPLRPAADAVRIDSGGLSIEEVVERLLERVRERGAARGRSGGRGAGSP